jgi:ribose transport system ATP-binding protein
VIGAQPVTVLQVGGAPPGPHPLLQVRGLTKTFGGTRALDGVDLEIHTGEVHGLIGQNGSGKSTLIKILSGYHAPDGGEVLMRGHRVRLPIWPGEAHRYGLSFLHQELSLAEHMTVLENLRLGHYDTTWYGRLRWKRERATVRALLETMDLGLDPDTPIRQLPQAERALIGVVRALSQMGGQGVLVLDEPTAYLPAPAVERLFAAIRAVTRRGSAVLFVSHRLDEVRAISDRISVLRDGRLIGTTNTASVTEDGLISMMLGRELGKLYPSRARPEGEILLSVRGLAGGNVQQVDLDVHRSEIVGLTGLVGMGQDEVPYLVFGASPRRSGEVAVAGGVVGEATPGSLRAAGVALVPADRQRASGVPRATVLENVTLPILDRFFQRGLLRRRTERSRVCQLLDRFDVRPPNPDLLLASLSGGNQQKALLAKWLQSGPLVLLLHEPTQGVDIGSRRQIFAIIREVAQSGTAVLIASAEYEDLAHICNRILIMRHGRIVSELTGTDLTEERIVEQCYRIA